MDKENLQNKEPEQIQSESEGVKIFDSKLAIEIVKSKEFKEELLRKLEIASGLDTTYSSIIEDLRWSDITGQFRRRTKKYLYVRYTLRGKQEVLKHIPPGAYPIIYKKTDKNKTETWIAVNRGQKLSTVIIINLDDEIDAKFPSIFNVAFLLVNPNDVEYLEIELDNNKNFPVYAKCGENCRWMPEKVLDIIKSILYDDIKNKLYEEEQARSQWTEEKDKQLENLFNKQVEKNLEIVFCKWNEYVKNAYLLPHITYDDSFEQNYYNHLDCGSNRFIQGIALIIPKPIFLPKQIHIKDPDEIKQIPEGIYPVIRLYQFSYNKRRGPQEIKKEIVFALSPNTEVVFEINYLTEDVFKNPYEQKWFKLSPKNLEFAVVWNNSIMRRRLLDFNNEFIKRRMDNLSRQKSQYSSLYWRIDKKKESWYEYMYYLPEVLFLHLVGENVKPKEEPFVAELILNSQKSWKEWNDWAKSIANKYNNIEVDNEKLEVLEFSQLHKMPGAWYVKNIKKHYWAPYELDYYELVIINMREENKMFKLKADFDLHLREDDVGRVFITVWPDGTIGRWLLELEGY
jgi:hypothetical protein